MIRNFLAALQFLTLFPLSSDYSLTADRRSASAYFPLIGLLIGLLLAGLDRLLGWIFPELLRSACLTVTLFILTGGLHLDGLADCADGFMSGRSKDDVLKIMKDPRSGPMGVAAVAGVLILKVAGLASLPVAQRWMGIVIFPLAGRSALTLLMGFLPYARNEGAALLFADRPRPWLAVFSGTILLAAGFMGGKSCGLWVAAFALVPCLFLGWLSRKKIGGYTGDVLGAACELTETAFILGWAAL